MWIMDSFNGDQGGVTHSMQLGNLWMAGYHRDSRALWGRERLHKLALGRTQKWRRLGALLGCARKQAARGHQYTQGQPQDPSVLEPRPREKTDCPGGAPQL